MKKTMLLCVASLLSLTIFSGCVILITPLADPSPVELEETYKDFTEVKLDTSMQARVTAGETYGLSISLNRDLHDKLSVVQVGETLILSWKVSKVTFDGLDMDVEITVPSAALKKVVLGVGASVHLAGYGLEADQFSARLDTSARLSGNLRVRHALDVTVGVDGSVDMNDTLLASYGNAPKTVVRVETSGAFDWGYATLGDTSYTGGVSSRSSLRMKDLGVLNYQLGTSAVLNVNGNFTRGDTHTLGVNSVLNLL